MKLWSQEIIYGRSQSCIIDFFSLKGYLIMEGMLPKCGGKVLKGFLNFSTYLFQFFHTLWSVLRVLTGSATFWFASAGNLMRTNFRKRFNKVPVVWAWTKKSWEGTTCIRSLFQCKSEEGWRRRVVHIQICVTDMFGSLVPTDKQDSRLLGRRYQSLHHAALPGFIHSVPRGVGVSQSLVGFSS